MIKSITQSQRLKSEFAEFNFKINNLQDDIKKHKARKLFDELQKQLNLIDNSHSSKGSYLQADPRLVRDNISNVVSLRKQLHTLLS